MKRATRLLALAAGIVVTAATPAGAENKVRFSLDWIPGAVHAPFFIAFFKGYHKAEGLDVAIDRGKGSAELVRQLASGVHDMGYPDISVVTDFDSKNPNRVFPVLLMGYEQAPAAIVLLKSGGITTPNQLEGIKLGAGANEATFKPFPIFAQHAGIDAEKITVQYIEPKLREVLLANREVDAIPGQIFNPTLELKAKGVAEADVRSFVYRDYGLDPYRNGVAASRAFLNDNPDAVRASSARPSKVSATSCAIPISPFGQQRHRQRDADRELQFQRAARVSCAAGRGNHGHRHAIFAALEQRFAGWSVRGGGIEFAGGG
jgi:NitT/TauT family transport system substrate-binding protein